MRMHGESGHGRGGFGGRGQRMGRGDVRPLLLVALLDGPAHGYELIRRLEQRSGGAWRPSPGSVYPTLQLLEETDLLVGQDEDGKRVYVLTDTGRAEAQQAVEMGAASRWDTVANPEGAQRADLRAAVGDLHVAARQVGEVADGAQLERAVSVVRDARQKLYQLLIEQ
jgi:DNA-binding PadR family transcriptional regulator